MKRLVVTIITLGFLKEDCWFSPLPIQTLKCSNHSNLLAYLIDVSFKDLLTGIYFVFAGFDTILSNMQI